MIDRADSRRALRAVHSAFYLSPQTLSIGVIGSGLIGGTFLNQLREEVRRLKAEFNIDLRVRAVADSKKMILDESQVDLSSWKDSLQTGTALDLRLERNDGRTRGRRRVAAALRHQFGMMRGELGRTIGAADRD